MSAKYHINIVFSGCSSHAGWNYDKEHLIKDYLIPFINGQVILTRRAEGMVLLNMKAVTSLVVYRTDHSLHPAAHALIPKEFSDPAFEKHSCTKEILDDARADRTAEPAKSLLQKAFAIPEDKVFVIMKFKDKALDSAYAGAIKPTIESFGLSCVRIDEIQSAGLITNEVLEAIASSRYVLAELSGSRQNCYYETGFAHALGKELILCIQQSETIHFDLAGYRFITWETELELRNQLKRRFEALTHSSQPRDAAQQPPGTLRG